MSDSEHMRYHGMSKTTPADPIAALERAINRKLPSHFVIISHDEFGTRLPTE
jgi:hypothetical protein